MHVQGPSKKVTFQRPKTAATTNKYDESRIKDKLAALERLESQLTDHIDEVIQEIDLVKIAKEAKDYADRDGKENGIRLTKAMVLENSMCDELREVKTLMLRDKKIAKFEDDHWNDFDFMEMCNVECLFASHNQISDIYGVCQLVTLVELNLSFNLIRDITGLEELTMLRSLYLNHNRIIQIDAIESLKDLRQLYLFNNEILSGTETIRILKSLPKLKELATDFNPCSSDMSFNFEIVLTLPKLRMFNDEAVRELDKDVARQHFR